MILKMNIHTLSYNKSDYDKYNMSIEHNITI